MIKRAPLTNFKLRETLNEDEQAKLMSMLTRSCRDILNGAPIPSYSEVYYNCDLLCRYGHWRSLNSAIYNEIQLWSRDQLASEGRETAKSDLLPSILSMWNRFEGKLRLLLDVFAVLDRVYVRRESGCVGLEQVVLSAFKTAVWEPEKGRLWRVALSHMDHCRVNNVVPGSSSSGGGGSVNEGEDECMQLRLFCGMLERLGVFTSDESQRMIVDRTVKYYNTFFNDASRSGNVMELPEKILCKLEWEVGFIHSAIPESLQAVLLSTVKKTLIGERLSVICGPSLTAAITENQTITLQRIHRLCEYNENKSQLCSHLTDTVKQYCSKYENIADLITAKLELEGPILVDAFQNDQQVGSAIREGLQACINQRTAFMSRLLANHFHCLMTTPITNASDKKTEIDEAVSLFRLLQGKDVFETLYKQRLGERLLRHTSIGGDFEHQAIGQMREECGAAFTSRMEGMFRDVSVSRDYQSAFQKSPQYRAKPTNTALQVAVITSGIWPAVPPHNTTTSSSSEQMYIPPAVQEDLKLFEQYYQKIAKKRKLKWEPMLAECTLRVIMSGTVVDIDMPAFVASVLLQFDHMDRMKRDDLLKKSGLDRVWFDKAVSILKHHKILTFSNTDIITYNQSCNFEGDRVNIFPADLVRFASPDDDGQQVGEPEEASAIKHLQDKEERAFRVDAAIVRFLKRRRGSQEDNKDCMLQDLQIAVGNVDILEERLRVLTEREFVEQRPDGTFVYLP